MSAPEIAHHVLLGVTPFLMSDHDAPLPAEHGHAARHRAIVGKTAVSMQFNPVRKTALNVIEREWPLIVPGDLDPLPRGQIVVNVTARFAKFYLEFSHRRAEINVMLCRMTLQILQPPFQFKDRLFKIERLPFHQR
jgi:hypothetical protein